MTHDDTEQLLNDLLRPTYVFRMARALIPPVPSDKPMVRGARVRCAKASAEIEKAVLRWVWRRMDRWEMSDTADCAPESCGGASYDPCRTSVRSSGIRHDGDRA